MKKIAKILAALLPVLAFTALFTSCSDDDDTEEDSLEFVGTFEFDLPTFLYQDTDYVITPTEVSRSEDDDSGNTGYGIGVTLSSTSTTDTLRQDYGTTKVSYTVHTPKKDTLGAFVVTMYAFSSGYTTLYAEKDCYLVDPALNTGSVTNFDIEDDDEYIVDGGRKYYLTRDKDCPVFMRQNYAGTDKGISYADCEAVTDIFGKYYTWEEAREVCPQGWHIPTKDEFHAFCVHYGMPATTEVDGTYPGMAGKLMADIYFNEEKMWEYWPDVRITDETGFSAMPTGYGDILQDTDELEFYGMNSYFAFWVSDPDEDSSNGVYRYINLKYDNVYRGVANADNFCASVRCVRD